jgi:hypothetical protein
MIDEALTQRKKLITENQLIAANIFTALTTVVILLLTSMSIILISNAITYLK